MGFYLRKSLSAGPFRVNLSKSGVGMSVGVPGFRVGSGPRGNYVHVGAHGVYYRTTLGGKGRGALPLSSRPTFSPPPAPPSSSVLMLDTTGATAADLVPTGSDSLVDQLNAAAKRHLLWPWLAAALALVAIVASGTPIIAVVVAVLAIPGICWLALWERARRTVVTFYDVTGRSAAWYDQLVSGFGAMTAMSAAWRIEASGAVHGTYQYKVNGGASSIVNRAGVRFTLSPPSTLTTNIAVPTFTSGRQSLLFLPDRVLLRSGRRWSDIAYDQLRIVAGATRFIETATVPRDAVQVDRTWRYVNVRGGPDRRFKDNPMLPVMLYGELILSSPGGLYWEIQCSRVDVAEWIAASLIKRGP